jgi:membrane associated rhomboid family serine protease
MDDPGLLDSSPPPDVAATSRRDRLLIRLLDVDPSVLLLQREAEVARVLGQAEPFLLVILSAPEGTSPDALRLVLKHHVKTVQPGSPPTHFVVVGGGDATAEAIKEEVPFIQNVRMGFHHLPDHAGLLLVKGKPLPVLERAAAHLDAVAPDGEARLAKAQEKGQQVIEQESTVVARLGGSGRVTTILAIACVALLGVSYAWGSDVHDAVLQRMGANIGADVRAGEVYRLFASAFLHANIVHLGFNMLALWSLGPFLESLLGRRRYLVLYAASALGGSLASTLFGGDRWSVGASGAIYGLMAAGISLSFRPKGLLPPLMVAGMRRRALTPLVINLAYSLQPGVDLLAHVGGGVVGGLLVATVLTDGLVPVEERTATGEAERKPSALYAAAAWILSAAMALSVVVAFVAGRPWQINAVPQLQRTTVGATGVSLELPSAVLEDVEHSTEKSVDIFTYGKLRRTPMVFEVIHNRFAEEVPVDQIEALLEQERRELDDHGPSGAKTAGPAETIMLGARKALRIRHELNGVKLETYLMVFGDHEVLVRSYALPSRPASWSGIERKVAETVSAAP